MEAYTSFARVYDTFMDNVPYKEWADYLGKILKEYGIDDGLVLDLGCGTGSMTEMLASSGYDMIGVDNAEEMLEIAMEKKVESGHDILYLLQDMREFELYGTVRAVISACDSVNYITDDEDLTEVFRLVNNYLDPEGLFVLIRSISIGRYLENRQLQKTVRNAALSGIIITMKTNGSMNMN